MKQNNYNKYLIALVAVFSMALFVGIFISSLAYWKYRDLGNDGLLAYQVEKINNAKGLNTVFVGDSSLGNSIDVNYFDELMGTTSASLALTGMYGYAGSFNMIKRSLKNNAIKNVIIMHTLDTMQRDISYDGYVFTMPELALGDHELYHAVRITEAFFKRVTHINGIKITIKNMLNPGVMHNNHLRIASYDYFPQGEKMNKGKILDSIIDVDAMPDKEYFLFKIKQLCVSKDLNCIYLHGPTHEYVVNNSEKYMLQANNKIINTEIKLGSTVPVIMTYDQIGDGIDHVSPQYKKEITKKYVDQVKSHI